jgi:predicted hotdog family 3-hydroxylacyl-ACP dehydratase
LSEGHPPIVSLIPHRGRSLLLEAVLDLRDDGIDCRGRIPAGASLLHEGRAPSILGIEMAAQAAAVFEALRRLRRGELEARPIGYLVGLRDVRFERPEMPADETFVASVRSIGSAPPLSRYSARVSGPDALYVSGELSAFLTAANRPG